MPFQEQVKATKVMNLVKLLIIPYRPNVVVQFIAMHVTRVRREPRHPNLLDEVAYKRACTPPLPSSKSYHGFSEDCEPPGSKCTGITSEMDPYVQRLHHQKSELSDADRISVALVDVYHPWTISRC